MDDAQHDVPDNKIPQLDLENAWKDAKLLKQDLDNGEGWTQRLHVPNEYTCWSETFPNDEVPVKVVQCCLQKRWNYERAGIKLMVSTTFI